MTRKQSLSDSVDRNWIRIFPESLESVGGARRLVPTVAVGVEMAEESVIWGKSFSVDLHQTYGNGCRDCKNSSQCFAKRRQCGVELPPSYTSYAMASFQLTYSDVLTLLSIVAVGMLIILLYNLIFFSISLRRISERLDSLSKDVEAVILKPIGAVDYLIDWFVSAIEGMQSGKKKHKDHHEKKGS